ncbi:uncharacterized protein LOC132619813 [Lycium barbarum]|uniref:uncharacterized protein LOC132619813 n=1 Tax=Lycium barbarum TaxID=112863 RepID=UPI00293F2172|nr:uncharacterized protein LOC132619813 [Lycium barbarum]
MLHRHHKFFLIALLEPFQQSRHIEQYKRKLHMQSAVANCNGKIWILVADNIEVEVVRDTSQQVTLKLFFHEFNQAIVTSIVYTKCDASDRLELWYSIYNLANTVTIPWMVSGDFNAILNQEEKISGLPVNKNNAEDFAFCINSCELQEVNFKGSPFTWWNGRADNECIFERLERMLINSQFLNWFGHIEVEHLARIGSDHAPLLCSYGEVANNIPRLFKFHNFLTDHESFLDTVKQNWISYEHLDPFISFKINLKRLKGVLSRWSREVYGDDIFKQLVIGEEIVRMKEELFEEVPSPSNRCVLQCAHTEYKRYLNFEEEYWKQKVGVDWFDEGDRNTRFFHNLVKGRRKKLMINRIQESDGAWLEDETQMAAEAIKFYQTEFS